MSIDFKGQRYCDECGRTIINAHRLHKGAEYCSSCYPVTSTFNLTHRSNFKLTRLP